MSDVFISYSRKDIAFARLIQESLQKSEVDIWIDWQRIPIGELWWKEINEAIQNANVFLFIISKNSITSTVCKDEINVALKNHKRIIPIIVGDLQPDEIKAYSSELPQFNWVIFEKDHLFRIEENPEVLSNTPEDRQVAFPVPPHFEDALEKLNVAIHTDWEWVKYHTRLQVNALLWESNQRNPSYLVRGSALEESERQLLNATGKSPQPTPLQVEFVTASRNEETQRQKEELRRQAEEMELEKKARQRQRSVIWVVCIGLALSIALGVLAWSQRNQYLGETHVRATAENVALSEANSRATAEAKAVAEANTRATAESNALSQANARATAEAVAVEQRDVAISRQLSAESNNHLSDSLDLALLLSAEAFKTDDSLQSRGSLLAAIGYSPHITRFLSSHMPEGVQAVAFSPDGKILAAGGCGEEESLGLCRQGEIILWDVASGQPIGQPLRGHSHIIMTIAYSPDGKTLASGGDDNAIILWDVSTPAQAVQIGKPLTGHTDWIRSVTFSPDGRILASVSVDNTIRLWDVSNPSLASPLGLPISPNYRPYSLTFKPESHILASSGCVLRAADSVCIGGEITFWNVDTHLQIGQSLFSQSKGLSNLAFSPDGKILISTSSDNTIILWDVAIGQPHGQPLGGHTDTVTGVVFSPDGKTLASASNDHTLRLWDVASMQEIGQPWLGHYGYITSIDFSPNNTTLASSSSDGNVILWDVTKQTASSIRFSGHNGNIADLAFSPDGKTLASGSSDQTVLRWEVATGKILGQPLKGSAGLVNSVAYSPDGSILASASTDGIIRLWDATTGQPLGQPFTGGPSIIMSIAFTPDGKMLVAGSSDGIIRFWDVQTGQSIGTPVSTHERLIGMVLSPDGATIASTGALDDINFWDSKTGQAIGQSMANAFVVSVAFSPDGKYMASAGYSTQVIRLWNAQTRQLIGEFTGSHSTGVWSIAFSPDSKVLASGNFDDTLILWDVATRQPIGAPLSGHLGNKFDLAFSPDGKTLATSSCGKVDGNNCLQGEIILWDLDPQSWLAQACSIANRNMTADEWTTYLGSLPYHKTCPELP